MNGDNNNNVYIITKSTPLLPIIDFTNSNY